MIAGAIAIIVAFLAVVIGLFAKKRARAQASWDQVHATVVSSNVEYSSVVYPDIHYEYVHQGRRFRGIRFRTLEVWFGGSVAARRVVDKYPVGTAVTIFVDPEDAENAVIESGGDPKFLPFISVLATFAFAVGLRLIWSATG